MSGVGTKRLREIAALRAVQCQAAELSAARTRRDADALEQAAEREAAALRTQTDSYRACLGGRTFDPGLTAIWGERVRRQAAAVGQSEMDRDGAVLSAEQEAIGWRRASHRLELAVAMADAAARKDRRRRHEALMADVADRLLYEEPRR